MTEPDDDEGKGAGYALGCSAVALIFAGMLLWAAMCGAIPFWEMALGEGGVIAVFVERMLSADWK